MKNIDYIVSELDQYIILCAKADLKVSRSSIGWHIEHSLKVIHQIVETLEKSNPNEYKWRFNFWRIVVITFQKIPRGRGKAPEAVLPVGEISMEILKQSMDKAKSSLKKIKNLDPNAHFAHPYFGLLNLKPTQIFLAIHTNHHLKIIKDIAKN